VPDFLQTIDINGPPSAVWAVVCDVRQLPALSPSTVRVWGEPEVITELGQTFDQEVRFAGRVWGAHWAVTTFEPGHALGIEGSAAGALYALTQSVEAIDGGHSRYWLAVSYRLPGGPLGWLVSRAGVDRYARAEALEVARSLKDLVEGDLAPRAGEVPETQR
jgi:Polyketide cyclase / dehydrase and lipid transport